MAEIAIGSGCAGCLGGVAVMAGVARRSRRRTESIALDTAPEAVKASLSAAYKVVPQPSPFGRHSSAPWAPLAAMSPQTHLRRQPDLGKVQGVCPDASLSKKPAEFRFIAPARSELDKEPFIKLLEKLIGESKHLQNNGHLGIIPEETRAANIVMEELRPYSTECGGPLVMEKLEYVAGRANLKVVYPGTTEKTTSFVGSHMDVVPADAEAWDRDPFTLTVDGDRLYGRGTTDCLGHVALITRLLADLGKTRPKLKRSIIVLFIAGEEGGDSGVGVDVAVEKGKLVEAKNGPVYWVDCADSQPCCGTSGMLSWSLKVSGRLFHSGIPQKGINSIELAMEAVSYIQHRFYSDFPPNPKEQAYQFAVGSTMKPTQVECAKGSLNQICPECTISGDVRLSPFYEVEDAMSAIETYVNDLNQGDMERLPTRGSWSKFALGPEVEVQQGELRRGSVEVKWQGTPESFKLYAGIACNLESDGHKALVQAFREANGSVEPFSVSGSLPLVKMMQREGFDIQLCGFGVMAVYHGVNEYCTMSEMTKAYETVVRTICLLEQAA